MLAASEGVEVSHRWIRRPGGKLRADYSFYKEIHVVSMQKR